MIPKTIHYCWFGRNKLTPEIEKCISSWRKYCPDWEIKEWNEDNSPMDISWIKDAYKHRKYAFVADYVRFYVLFNEGGVYMDTDMMLIKPIDALLDSPCFLGMEDKLYASMGIIGANKNNIFCKECLDYYDSTRFNLLSPPIITRFITPLLFKYGFVEEDKTQILANGMVIYQSDWFYPIHYTEKYKINDMNKYITENTLAVHLWNDSWRDDLRMLCDGEYKEGFRLAIKRILRNPILPIKYYMRLGKYLVYWMVR